MAKDKASKIFDKQLLVKIFSLALPYKFKFYTAVVLTLSMAILGPIRPYLIQHALDSYVAQKDAQGLLYFTLFIFFLLLVQSVIQWWSTILANFLGQQIIYDLRNKVYKHLLSLRLNYFDKTPVGTLVTRSISDIETISEVFSEGLINIVGDMLQIVFLLLLMFGTNVKLSLVCLSVLPFLFYSGYLFKEKIKESFEDVRNQVARLNTFVQEHLSGMQIVQLFGREDREMEAFKEINEAHKVANVKSVFYYSVFFPVVEVLSAISIGLLVWYGAKGVVAEEITVGTLVAFILYLNLFFRPIRQLADRFNNLQMGMIAGERIFQLLEDEEPKEISGRTKLENTEGNISFKEVGFAYIEGQPVLKNINFEVKKGQTIALVGATGAGKSSIINLLSRFYEINQGSICIDGTPIQEFTLDSLRSKISVVMQDVFLFTGSILENIQLYDKSIPEAEIIAMAKKLGAHDFISKMPNGYHQMVTERGASLSVGQRQLISFVRAMVVNPAILVLDEATSSIDHETEEIIQQAIVKMREGRSSIVIAHRLSTIANADEILVLQKGEIVERGTHTQLLQKEGYYHKLYQYQFV
ncbi:MAG: ABC transporter ATP-binding protein/permease [Bacteroidia bacterium]|nr:ABC transporter ATP-binding protein/permease [Bacteroidia bacterium]MCF8426974.1 ABC transporter ATP-binding protein/permease [Bacteroidia bacterium]MCF8445593.1 ABC transporter ATP-binding protein/permease [Bacteroidia bacterium]